MRGVTGSVRFAGQERLGPDGAGFAGLRGVAIGAVFQDPMSSLNPVLSIGEQIDEVLRRHKGLGRPAPGREPLEILREVGIADPAERAAAFPHQLSGGLRQRAATPWRSPPSPGCCWPTSRPPRSTRRCRRRSWRCSTRCGGAPGWRAADHHDFGVAAEIADRIAVLYAGAGRGRAAAAMTEQPLHPYAQGLLRPPSCSRPAAAIAWRKSPDRRPTRGRPSPAAPSRRAARRRWSVAGPTAGGDGAGRSPRPLLPPRPRGRAMTLLALEGVSKSFAARRHRRLAVDQVSLSVAQGEILGLVGESGCGKSTLARLALR